MKKIIIAMSIIGLAISFSGCSNHIKYVQVKDDPTLKDKRLVVGAKTKSNSMFRLADAIESAYMAFQYAAEETISTGNNYFVIRYPKKLSGYDGSLVDSIAEFDVQCVGEDSYVGSMFDRSNLDGWVCYMTSDNPHYAYLEIDMFKEEPLATHFNAREVLNELESKGVIIDESDRELRAIDTGVNESTLSYSEYNRLRFHKMAYGKWAMENMLMVD